MLAPLDINQNPHSDTNHAEEVQAINDCNLTNESGIGASIYLQETAGKSSSINKKVGGSRLKKTIPIAKKQSGRKQCDPLKTKASNVENETMRMSNQEETKQKISSAEMMRDIEQM